MMRNTLFKAAALSGMFLFAVGAALADEAPWTDAEQDALIAFIPAFAKVSIGQPKAYAVSEETYRSIPMPSSPTFWSIQSSGCEASVCTLCDIRVHDDVDSGVIADVNLISLENITKIGDEYDQMGQQLWSIDKLNGNVFYADDFDGTSASVSKRAIDWCAGNGAIKTHEPDLNFLIGAH